MSTKRNPEARRAARRLIRARRPRKPQHRQMDQEIGPPPHNLGGNPATTEQKKYLASLQNTVYKYQLEKDFIFSSTVPHPDVPGYLQQGDVFVSACNSGIDKAILEAMACELPVMVSNPAFRPILGIYADQLMFLPNDAESLADQLQTLLCLPQVERMQLGVAMRQIVVASHDVSALIRKIVTAFRAIHV